MKINVSTIYLYLPAEMQKWTKVDAFFVYFIFFSIFSLIPLSTCYYVITLFSQNTPFYQRLCVFFTFLTPFFTLFCTFSRLFTPPQSLTTKANLLTSRLSSPSHVETQSRNPPPARTRGHRRPPRTSFILFSV